MKSFVQQNHQEYTFDENGGQTEYEFYGNSGEDTLIFYDDTMGPDDGQPSVNTEEEVHENYYDAYPSIQSMPWEGYEFAPGNAPHENTVDWDGTDPVDEGGEPSGTPWNGFGVDDGMAIA